MVLFHKIFGNKRNSNRFVAGSPIVLALTKLIILDKNRSQYLLFVRSLTFNNGHNILMCTSVHSQKSKDRPVNGFGANKLTIDNRFILRLSQGSEENVVGC